MRMVIRSLSTAVLALCAAAAQSQAQQHAGSGTFQWYVGGHGGVMSFRTAVQGRELMPVAGGQILITAKRTGLLLSVDQGFGSDEPTTTLFTIRDSTGVASQPMVMGWTFQGFRKYSAMLMAFPVRNPNVQPFLGIGGGIMHTTGNSGGPFADGSVENHLSSSGFLSAAGGLEFRVGPFGAFGMYQITTKQGYKQIETVLQRDQSGKAISTRADYGEWTLGATHTVTAGLRIGLGSAREDVRAGGY